MNLKRALTTLRYASSSEPIYMILAIFKWIRGAFISEGTYGRVYLALNATSGELIAVKQVELAKANNDNDDNSKINRVEALRNESEMLKDIDHPNIVQYLGFEQTSDFLSMCVYFDLFRLI